MYVYMYIYVYMNLYINIDVDGPIFPEYQIPQIDLKLTSNLIGNYLGLCHTLCGHGLPEKVCSKSGR